MRLKVVPASVPGNQQPMETAAREEDTAASLKHTVAARWELQPSRLRLIAAGKHLPDARTLGALGIRDGHTVHAVYLPSDAPAPAAATAATAAASLSGRPDDEEAAFAVALAALRGGERGTRAGAGNAETAEAARFIREQIAALRAFERQRSLGATAPTDWAQFGAPAGGMADDSDDETAGLVGTERGSGDCLVGMLLGFFVGVLAILCIADRSIGRRFKLGIFFGAMLNAAFGVARAMSSQARHTAIGTPHLGGAAILDEHWN